MSLIYPIDKMTQAQTAQVAARIDAGAVAVFPTDTVYGIGTNAFNEEAISRIYQIKQRPASSALQILVGNARQAREITRWDENAEKLARAFWPGALTVILRPNEKGLALRRGFEGLGLRVPGRAALTRLLALMKAPMASTSANLHGRPVITQEEELLNFFDGKADIILTGGDLSPVASSVIDMTAQAKLLREAAVGRARLEEVLGFAVK